MEQFLVESFNIIIGVNHEKFNEKLFEARENSYISSNNMFIGYIVLANELKQKYGEGWQDELQAILGKLDFSKTNDTWKTIGIENNINLSTIKKIATYFKSLVEEGVA